MKDFTCTCCARVLPIQTMGGTGYADAGGGNAICYDCVAKADVASMLKNGKGVLYLTERSVGVGVGTTPQWIVQNWPGTLVFLCISNPKVSVHNVAKTRRDAYFFGPDGKMWHAISFGDSLLARCAVIRRQKKHWGVASADPSRYLKPYNYSR